MYTFKHQDTLAGPRRENKGPEMQISDSFSLKKFARAYRNFGYPLIRLKDTLLRYQQNEKM